MKHILFIVTNTFEIGENKQSTGYEFSEVADPYLEFIKNGHHVDFASLFGGKPPEDGYQSNHTNSKLFRESSAFNDLNQSLKLSDINIDHYDAIFFPGGLGPMVDMLDNILIKKIIKEVYESGRTVGAVCHGVAALLNVKLSNGRSLLKGKRVTSFTKAEEEEKGHTLGAIIPYMLDEWLENQGANISWSSPFETHVVVDDNLITGQNPASAIGVAIEMMKSKMPKF